MTDSETHVFLFVGTYSRLNNCVCILIQDYNVSINFNVFLLMDTAPSLIVSLLTAVMHPHPGLPRFHCLPPSLSMCIRSLVGRSVRVARWTYLHFGIRGFTAYKAL